MQPRNHETSYEYLVSDNKFHAVTYHVAGEMLAAELIESTMAHYSRVRLLVDLDNAYKDRTVSDHSNLIRLIEAGNKEEYRKVLTTHLGRVLGDLEQKSQELPDLFEMG